jgi:hypothetical protein
MGGWVDTRVCLDAVVKRKIPSLSWDLNPPIIQPIDPLSYPGSGWSGDIS